MVPGIFQRELPAEQVTYARQMVDRLFSGRALSLCYAGANKHTVYSGETRGSWRYLCNAKRPGGRREATWRGDQRLGKGESRLDQIHALLEYNPCAEGSRPPYITYVARPLAPFYVRRESRV